MARAPAPRPPFTQTAPKSENPPCPSPPSPPLTRRLALLPLAAAAFALPACNTAPAGDTGGVIDSRERTRVDLNASEADSTSLLEFADRVGQELGSQLARIPEIKSSPTQVIIELGSIQNNTRTPSSDFAAMQRRVFLTLQRSDIVRENAQIRERYDRVARDAAGMEAPVQVDPLGREAPTQSGPVVDRGNLAVTYFLQGTFSELVRGPYQSTFQLDFTLTKATTRQIVYSNLWDFKQLR